LEALHQSLERAMHGNERGDLHRCQEAIPGGAVVQEDDVARLFTADDVAALEHFFKNVAVADAGSGERDAFAGEDALETEIGHGSSDNAVPIQLACGLEIAGDG